MENSLGYTLLEGVSVYLTDADVQHAGNGDDNDCADYRHRKTCGMELRSLFRFLHQASDCSTNERTDDAKQCASPEVHVLLARHKNSGHNANDKPYNENPDKLKKVQVMLPALVRTRHW